MKLSAKFSTDSNRTYRYTLGRVWDESKKQVMFIGLNPSTADEKKDDPTITRCINFAKSWDNGGYGSLVMCNLFAFRATKPEDLKSTSKPTGAENDKCLIECAKKADLVVLAWGNHGMHLGRDKEVRKILKDSGVKLHCLAQNLAKNKDKEGQPSHPLYLAQNLKPYELK